jgi:hypothetical protein
MKNGYKSPTKLSDKRRVSVGLASSKELRVVVLLERKVNPLLLLFKRDPWPASTDLMIQGHVIMPKRAIRPAFLDNHP